MLKRIGLILLAAVATMGLLAGVLAEPEQPAEDDGPALEEGADESPQPANGYVLVTTATQMGWLPLPEEGDISYPLTQLMPDGTEAVNVIHLTPDSVYMEDASCSNHDCVGQGTVTLDNRKDRILGNMIICLPNQVTLQLFTPEEVLEAFQGE